MRAYLRTTTMLAAFAVVLLLSYRSLALQRLEGRIVDDRTGLPVAATLALTDGDGKRLEIDHSHVDYLGKRRCYTDGSFALSTRPARLVIELRRGLETLPLRTELDLNERGTEPLTFRLRRWIDCSARSTASDPPVARKHVVRGRGASDASSRASSVRSPRQPRICNTSSKKQTGAWAAHSWRYGSGSSVVPWPVSTPRWC